MTIMDASSFGPSDEALLTMNSSSRKITGSGRLLSGGGQSRMFPEDDSGVHDSSGTTAGSPTSVPGSSMEKKFPVYEEASWRQSQTPWSTSAREFFPKSRASSPLTSPTYFPRTASSCSRSPTVDGLTFDFFNMRMQSSPSSNTASGVFGSSSQGAESSASIQTPKRLHVSNIPFRYREHNLIMLFGKYGNVEDAEIIYNDKGSKGFGFITMARSQDADRARLMLNNTIVEGRIIEVNLATPKNSSASRSNINPIGSYSHATPTIPIPQNSTIVWRKPSSPMFTQQGQKKSSSEALLEAEAKLAEAQLEVLRARQRLIYHQFSHGTSSIDGQFSFDARKHPRV